MNSKLSKYELLELQQRTLLHLIHCYPQGLCQHEDSEVDGWDPYYLLKNPSLPIWYIEDKPEFWEFKRYAVSQLSKNHSINLEFVIKHYDNIRWYDLAKNPFINIDIIEAYPDKFDYLWRVLLDNPYFTDELLIEEGDRLLLTIEARYKISLDYELDKAYKMLWSRIRAAERRLDVDNLDKIEYFYGLELTSKINMELVDKFSNLPCEDQQCPDCCDDQCTDGKWEWSELSENPNLTTDIILKYSDKLNLWGLCRYVQIGPEVIYPLYRKMDLHELLAHCKLNIQLIEFLLSHQEDPNPKTEWKLISKNPNLNSEILEHYVDNWGYNKLSKNSSVPYTFILNHPERNWNVKRLIKRTYLPVINEVKSC